MTRAQAIDRVRKLKALAKGSTNPNEKKSAAKRALELMEKHNISSSDVEDTGKVAAFDKMVDLLGQYTSLHPDVVGNTFGLAKVIEDILGHAKKELPHNRKVTLLDTIARGVGIAKLFAGNDNQTINDLSGIVDSVMKTYNS